MGDFPELKKSEGLTQFSTISANRQLYNESQVRREPQKPSYSSKFTTLKKRKNTSSPPPSPVHNAFRNQLFPSSARTNFGPISPDRQTFSLDSPVILDTPERNSGNPTSWVSEIDSERDKIFLEVQQTAKNFNLTDLIMVRNYINNIGTAGHSPIP